MGKAGGRDLLLDAAHGGRRLRFEFDDGVRRREKKFRGNCRRRSNAKAEAGRGKPAKAAPFLEPRWGCMVVSWSLVSGWNLGGVGKVWLWQGRLHNGPPACCLPGFGPSKANKHLGLVGLWASITHPSDECSRRADAHDRRLARLLLRCHTNQATSDPSHGRRRHRRRIPPGPACARRRRPPPDRHGAIPGTRRGSLRRLGRRRLGRWRRRPTRRLCRRPQILRRRGGALGLLRAPHRAQQRDVAPGRAPPPLPRRGLHQGGTGLVRADASLNLSSHFVSFDAPMLSLTLSQKFSVQAARHFLLCVYKHHRNLLNSLIMIPDYMVYCAQMKCMSFQQARSVCQLNSLARTRFRRSSRTSTTSPVHQFPTWE
jgi:hypothetical protein